MSICPASADWSCISEMVCDDRGICARLHSRPIDVIDISMMVHFVGFRGEEYNSAVAAFGKPDFIHRTWDLRALSDIADGDMVVFARYHDSEPSRYSYDD